MQLAPNPHTKKNNPLIVKFPLWQSYSNFSFGSIRDSRCRLVIVLVLTRCDDNVQRSASALARGADMYLNGLSRRGAFRRGKRREKGRGKIKKRACPRGNKAVTL